MLDDLWGTQPAPPLKPTDVRLQTYTGEEISVVGRVTVKVQYQVQEEKQALQYACPGDPTRCLGMT